MKNDYEVRGDMTAIFLRRRDGTVLETIIDTDDLPTVQDLNGAWYAFFEKWTGTFYVRGTTNKWSKVWMHRFIMEPPIELIVDHINHDSLDNRRSNLRVITKAQNNKNRIAENVTWDKRWKHWNAKVKDDRKDIFIGTFKTREEAYKAAREFKAKNIPGSYEALQLSLKGGDLE